MAAGKGLQASIWATSVGIRDGDWICGGCHFDNFQWREECLRCQTQKERKDRVPPSVYGGVHGKEVRPFPSIIGDPFRRNATNGRSNLGGVTNDSQAHVGRGIGVNGSTKRESSPNVPNSNPASIPNGLAMSRWAPRNFGRHNAGAEYKPQVWTRVCSFN